MRKRGEWGGGVSKEEQVGDEARGCNSDQDSHCLDCPSWLQCVVTGQPWQVWELTGGALRASVGRPRLLVRCSPRTYG